MLPQLLLAVDAGSPALASQSLGVALVQGFLHVLLPHQTVMTCVCVTAGILKTLAASADSRARVLQGLKKWQWQGLAHAILKPVRFRGLWPR